MGCYRSPMRMINDRSSKKDKIWSRQSRFKGVRIEVSGLDGVASLLRKGWTTFATIAPAGGRKIAKPRSTPVVPGVGHAYLSCGCCRIWLSRQRLARSGLSHLLHFILRLYAVQLLFLPSTTLSHHPHYHILSTLHLCTSIAYSPLDHLCIC
jgi:hypothetical protein